VGARVADANTHSIGSVLSSTARTDTPTELPMPQPVENAPSPIQATALSSHQSALLALSHSLESMTDVDPNEVAARSRHVLTGPQGMIDVSIDRVEGFLSQQRARFKQEMSKT
jgi:hypothetical protein